MYLTKLPLLNEQFLEEKRPEIQDMSFHVKLYCLLVVRCAVFMRLSAASFADNLEIQVTGDLLVNPGEIDIHVTGAHQPLQFGKPPG
jgi:hypothetical protein